MKFCTNCGSQMPVTASNCPNCGTLQAQQQPVPQQPVAGQPMPQQPVPMMQQAVQPVMQQQPMMGQPMGMAPMPQMMQPQNGLFKTILLITIIGAIGSCFLPLITAGGESMNFVYYAGEVLDGVFIIAAEVIALICLLCKTRIPVFILQLPACGILIADFPDLTKTVGSSYLGIGFYLVIVMVVASTVLSLLRIIMKNQYE